MATASADKLKRLYRGRTFKGDYMADTVAIVGKNSTLGYSDSVGGSYTTFAEVTDLILPSEEVGEVDATHNLSPDSYEETIPNGWIKTGSVTATLTYEPVEQATLRSLLGVKKFYQITTPDSATCTFEGFLSKLDTDLPTKDKCTTKIAIKPTGVVTFAANS